MELILNIITWASLAVCLLAGCALDSESMLPLIVFVAAELLMMASCIARRHLCGR